jgi:hypothetical protein
MRTNGRHVDKRFAADEYLFRRVPPSVWEKPEERPGPDAVKLTDVSVGRRKYAHPEWLRFDVVKNQHYHEWGIIGFMVGDIPPSFWNLAVYLYTFETHHDPKENDYPHSEIRAFNNSEHIEYREGENDVDLDKRLPEDIHLKWRIAMLKKMRVFLRPGQIIQTRQNTPTSHKPETLPGL